MNTIPALVLTDFYKTDHRRQFPDGTTAVYSNFTPRGSRLADVDHVVFFGLQYFVMEYLQKRFHETFFALPKAKAVGAYRRRLDTSLGAGAVPMDHVEALHDLGHLPLRIKALPEGTRVPMQVPTHRCWCPACCARRTGCCHRQRAVRRGCADPVQAQRARVSPDDARRPLLSRRD